MKNILKKQDARTRISEERLYEEVSTEVEKGEIKKGLWAKALIDSKNDEAKAKGLYIKYRIQNIADEKEITEKEILRNKTFEEKRNKEKLVNTNIYKWIITLTVLTGAVEIGALFSTTKSAWSSVYGFAIVVLFAVLFVLWKVRMRFALNRIFFFLTLSIFMIPEIFEEFSSESLGEFMATLIILSVSNILIIYLAIRFLKDPKIEKTTPKKVIVGICLAILLCLVFLFLV
jgi:hypothetical protein